ncbi:MAG: hypothetical protein IJT94_02240, partial [Oscillibacter sp.]|nr:hypothetical protein [Oscillibacter sp.]
MQFVLTFHSDPEADSGGNDCLPAGGEPGGPLIGKSFRMVSRLFRVPRLMRTAYTVCYCFFHCITETTDIQPGIQEIRVGAQQIGLVEKLAG